MFPNLFFISLLTPKICFYFFEAYLLFYLLFYHFLRFIFLHSIDSSLVQIHLHSNYFTYFYLFPLTYLFVTVFSSVLKIMIKALSQTRILFKKVNSSHWNIGTELMLSFILHKCHTSVCLFQSFSQIFSPFLHLWFLHTKLPKCLELWHLITSTFLYPSLSISSIIHLF